MTKNKNIDQYEQALTNLREKKELLPLHKMDDVSRRKFIKSVGYFLGAIGVTSTIRFETMSSLSKKIFGNSLAYAANPAADVYHLHINCRAGWNTRNQVAIYGDDTNLTDISNVPWTTGLTVHPTRGMPVILPPSSQALAPFAGAIQHVVAQNFSGHSEYFQTTQRAGFGHIIGLSAATQTAAGAKTVVKTPFYFGNPQKANVTDMPASLTEFTPQIFDNVYQVGQAFTPLRLKSHEGTDVAPGLRDLLFAAIGSKFRKDVTNGVLQKKADNILSSNQTGIKILAQDFTAALNPDNHPDVMAVLQNNLGNPGRFQAGSTDPIKAILVLLKAAELGATPMIGGYTAMDTDWHGFNDRASGTGSTDMRYITAAYFSQLIANACTAASSGMFVNPTTGAPMEVRFHIYSEFARTISLQPSGVYDDNGDGETSTSLTIGSNINQQDYLPGCFGGADASHNHVGFNPSSFAHSTNIAWANADVMFGDTLNKHRVDKNLFNLKAYSGFSGGFV